MFLIEPCCTQRHWPALRSKIGQGGTTFFHAYGDLSLEELLPVMMGRYSETRMTVVCPTLPNAAAALLADWMRKEWARADGKGNLDVIRELTVITDLRAKKSPDASRWLKENPFPGRLVLHNVQQNDTAVLLPDIAVFGSVNLTHNGHFTALATTNSRVIESLRETYAALAGGGHKNVTDT